MRTATTPRAPRARDRSDADSSPDTPGEATRARLWTVRATAQPPTQNRGMLRLAASAPPLWRTPTSLQLGADAVVRLDDVRPWQEHLLTALTLGLADGAVPAWGAQRGVGAGELDAFLAMIAPALDVADPGPVRVRYDVDDAVTDTDRDRLAVALAAAGIIADDDAPLHLVVASRLVDPHRASALVSADIAHLPVELAGDRVGVGPLVVPGRSACLACTHAARRDRDPAWPAVAAQLLARRAASTAPVLIVEAAAVALRLLSAPAAGPQASAVLRAGSAPPQWHEHRPHPDCWCRSPSRSATPAAHAAPTSAPTTATAFARPA